MQNGEMIVIFLLGICLGAAAVTLAYCFWPDKLLNYLGIAIISRQRNLNKPVVGYWYSIFYRRKRNGTKEELTHIIQVSRLKNYYYARVIKGEFHHFHLSGVLFRQQYVTGIWQNNDIKRAYQGSFQLRLHDNGQAFTGKWLGWNQDEAISAGLWAMVKMEEADLELLKMNPKRPMLGDSSPASSITIKRRLDCILKDESERDCYLNWKDA